MKPFGISPSIWNLKNTLKIWCIKHTELTGSNLCHKKTNDDRTDDENDPIRTRKMEKNWETDQNRAIWAHSSHQATEAWCWISAPVPKPLPHHLWNGCLRVNNKDTKPKTNWRTHIETQHQKNLQQRKQKQYLDWRIKTTQEDLRGEIINNLKTHRGT